mmetsp:Transcript_3363/g.8391  ORF Transcript_3363/g.8391 Transcript_3363/m.8391 type:complete len:201 (+) Transcript_3363:400-1002(+)
MRHASHPGAVRFLHAGEHFFPLRGALEQLARAVDFGTARGGHEHLPVAERLPLREVRAEELLDQRVLLCLRLLARQLDQAVRVERVAQQPVHRVVGDALRLERLLHERRHLLHPLHAELGVVVLQLRLALRREAWVEKERPPLDLEGEAECLARLGHRALKPPLPDPAPRSYGVRDDLDEHLGARGRSHRGPSFEKLLKL